MVNAKWRLDCTILFIRYIENTSQYSLTPWYSSEDQDMCIVKMGDQSKLTPCNNVKIGNYIVGETLGCGTFGKVKREL